jgi:prepilin-type N-terminal cleavage/methylation domain-containing protein
MRLKKSLGFTLIELVMVLTIMSVISVVVGKSLFEAFQTFITAQNALEVDWNGFIALQRINNDVHTIRSAASIATISAANFVFTDISGTSVQYQLTGSNLMRNSQILADGIQSLSFTYSDKNGSVTATPSLVRYVTITVTPIEGNLTLPFTTVAATRVYP